jgi:hypothetical protein
VYALSGRWFLRGLLWVRAGKLGYAIGVLASLLLATSAAIAPLAAANGAAVIPATAANLTYGAAAAANLGQLPYLEPTAMAGGQSSFDRDQRTEWDRKADFGHFLATGRRGNVMLEQQGPGCVYRIFLSSLQRFFPSDWVRIYFDGRPKPTINITIRQMFSGSTAPFLSPLVRDEHQSSGGYVSYVPLCYRRSIEITTNSDRYYDIGYLTYPSNADIKTWTPSQSTAALRAEWARASADPIATAGNTVASGTVTLRPHVAQTLLSIKGLGSIQSLKIKIPGVTASAGPAAANLLDHVWILMHWDGAKTPNVDAPAGSFFALGQFGSYPAHGLVAGLDSQNNLYMYLPMPFQRRAVIQLVDTGSQNMSGIKYQIEYRPFTGNFSDVGYFTTSYTTIRRARTGKDIPILTAAGSGKLIGVTGSYIGDLKRLYLEGDERIYVDGSRSPAFYGSGTEDFFNGGFDFYYGPYAAQLSGNTAHVITQNADETAAYRFFLPDAIPFRDGIVVTMQHGYDDTTRESAAMLAYYYDRRAPQGELTDELDVADPVSDRRHGFVIRGQDWSGSHTYQFEGTHDSTSIMAAGRGFRGYSQFTMTILPGNEGVDLRRMYDQGIASQKAKVYVDGRTVGIWYVAGQNIYHRWSESDFVIPAAYTAGKRSIVIRIRYLGGRPDFTEYKYWAFSLVG